MTELYDDLGLRPIINASATLTRLGGSRMPPEVVEAMSAAAGSFVDLNLLQERVGAKIAQLTQNEACYVSSGAAAGIMLAVASCIAGTDPANTFAFPQLDGLPRTEVIVQKVQRNGYDYAIAQTGATVIEIGNSADELEAAIGDRTACVVWFAGGPLAREALPVEEVIAIARTRGVPVLVDAAAQIPPVASLWRYTAELGATGAIFSGGKGIRGPQSSGLVLGTRELIAGCRANGNPNHSLGRPMKVGKEELAGILAAVEYTLIQDEDALIEQYESIVHGWIEDLTGIPGVTAERRFPSEAGQPHGRTFIHFSEPCPVTRDEMVAALWDGDPKIAVTAIHDEPDAIALNPQTVGSGEAAVIVQRIKQVIGDRE
jgi:L-seryl-tRNA(Ser) seleniumtransferase